MDAHMLLPEGSSAAGGMAGPSQPSIRLRVRAAAPLPTTQFILPLPPQSDYAQLEALVRNGLAAHLDPSQTGTLLPGPNRELILEQAGFKILPIYPPAQSLRDGDVIDVRVAVKPEPVHGRQSYRQHPADLSELPVPSALSRSHAGTSILQLSSDPEADGDEDEDEDEDEDDEGAKSSESDSTTSSSPSSLSQLSDLSSSISDSESDDTLSSTSSDDELSAHTVRNNASSHTPRPNSTSVEDPLAGFPLPPANLVSSTLSLAGLIPTPGAKGPGDSSSTSDEDGDQPLLVPLTTRKLNESIATAHTSSSTQHSASTSVSTSTKSKQQQHSTQSLVPPGSGSAETARTNAQKKRKRPAQLEQEKQEILRKRNETGTWDYEDDNEKPEAAPQQVSSPPFTIDTRPGREEVTSASWSERKNKRTKTSNSVEDSIIPLGSSAADNASHSGAIRIAALRKGGRKGRKQIFTGRQGLSDLFGISSRTSGISSGGSGSAPLLPPGLGSLGFDDEEDGSSPVQIPISTNKEPAPVIPNFPRPLGAVESSGAAIDALSAFEAAKRRRLIQDVSLGDAARDAIEDNDGSNTSTGKGGAIPFDTDALRDIVARAVEEDAVTQRKDSETQAQDRKEKANAVPPEASTSVQPRAIHQEQASLKPAQKRRQRRNKPDFYADTSLSNGIFLEQAGFVPPSERPRREIPKGMIVTRVDCDEWHEQQQAVQETLAEYDRETANLERLERKWAADRERPKQSSGDQGQSLRLQKLRSSKITEVIEVEDDDEPQSHQGDKAKDSIPNGNQPASRAPAIPLQNVRPRGSFGNESSAGSGPLKAKMKTPSTAATSAPTPTTAADEDPAILSDTGFEFVSQTRASVTPSSAASVKALTPASSSAGGSMTPVPSIPTPQQQLVRGTSSVNLQPSSSSPAGPSAQLALLRAKALMSKGAKKASGTPQAATKPQIPESKLKTVPVATGPTGVVVTIGGPGSEVIDLTEDLPVTFTSKAAKSVDAADTSAASGPKAARKGRYSKAAKQPGPSTPIDFDRISAQASTSTVLDYGAGADSDSD